MKKEYVEYIKSPAWKKKRQELFDLRGECCEQCGFEYYLHVHHLTYENFGNEKMEDLKILCYHCHMSKHDKYFDKYVKKKPKKKKLKKKKLKNKKKNRLKGLSKRDKLIQKKIDNLKNRGYNPN